MFKLITTLVRGLRPRKAALVRLGEEAFDEHVLAYWDMIDRQVHETERAQWLAERALVAKAWDALEDAEREAVIAECDTLNAQGRLEDHRFFDQWLDLRTRGHGGD